MSHYAVGVITKKKPDEYELEELLAPFDENIVVERYIRKTKKEAIEDAKKELLEREKAYLRGESGEEFYKKYVQPYIKYAKNNDEENLYDYAIKYEEKENIDDDGNITSTYNPKSKWDWWMVGGRFSDILEKDSVQIKKYPKAEDLSEEEAATKYPELYDEWMDIMQDKHEGFYRNEYLQKRYPTFMDFYRHCKNCILYAILDENGEWHEPGAMGWFGMSSANEKDEQDWDKNFYKNFIDSKNKNWWITIVDCHI